MDIKNFQNPWAEGGEFYPNWLGGEEVLGKSAISPDVEFNEYQQEEDNFDSIDVIIESSSIEGVKQMSFIKTHKAPIDNPDLRVRYLDEKGAVLWTGDNFKVGTLEYELFNKKSVYYNVTNRDGSKSSRIILEGTAKTPKVEVKAWVAWNRFSIAGEVIPNSPTREPNGHPFKEVRANRFLPNSLFYFTAYFENHSISEIINQAELDQIIQDIKKTFENGGKLAVKAENAYLSAKQVAFMVVGYHSPEVTNNTGLNNTQLAIGRAETVQKLLNQRLSSIGITAIGSTTGGDSQEPGVRPAITYFGAKGFIDSLGISYVSPTIGE